MSKELNTTRGQNCLDDFDSSGLDGDELGEYRMVCG
jgi:hypothetical protein